MAHSFDTVSQLKGHSFDTVSYEKILECSIRLIEHVACCPLIRASRFWSQHAN